MEWTGVIATGRAAQVRMGIHQARHDRLPGDVNNLRALRDRCVHITDRNNFSVLYNEDPLRNRVAGCGMDVGTPEGNGSRLRCKYVRGEEKKERQVFHEWINALYKIWIL
jgi:hypothetical protein